MKTRVRKRGGNWCVEYYMPYSGNLYALFPRWEDAIHDAFEVERYKGYI